MVFKIKMWRQTKFTMKVSTHGFVGLRRLLTKIILQTIEQIDFHDPFFWPQPRDFSLLH